MEISRNPSKINSEDYVFIGLASKDIPANSHFTLAGMDVIAETRIFKWEKVFVKEWLGGTYSALPGTFLEDLQKKDIQEDSTDISQYW